MKRISTRCFVAFILNLVGVGFYVLAVFDLFPLPVIDIAVLPFTAGFVLAVEAIMQVRKNKQNVKDYYLAIPVICLSMYQILLFVSQAISIYNRSKIQ